MRRATAVWAVMGLCVAGTTAFAQSVRQGSDVTLRLASVAQVSDFQPMALGEQNVFVSKRTLLSGTSLESAEAVVSRGGADLLLTLANDAVRRLGAVLRGSEADLLAVFVGGRMVGAGSFSFSAPDARLTVSGLPAFQARQVSDLIGGHAATGATLSLVPSSPRLFPGRPVDVDIIVSGVADLRTYQVTLDISGGDTGQLLMDDLRIDSTRPDYVFGTLQKIDAADITGRRIGSVLFTGGVDATDASYLGTVTLRPSDDASGTFRVTAKSGSRTTLLWSSQNEPVDFSTQAAVLTIGQSIKGKALRK